MTKFYSIIILTGVIHSFSFAQINPRLQSKVNAMIRELEPKVVEWRRDIHQHPELSNREFKTAAKVAGHLKSLGMDVKTEVAHTGVVAVLKGGKPGPVVALRADMDALPVTEQNDLPFASREKAIFNDQETGVMHACGHDAHVAILMGVAEILAKNRSDLKGTVKFIFQPAEEGAPEGEEGGAKLMIEEGVLENPKVDVIFGLHIQSFLPLGKIKYRPGGMMAATDWFTIKVKGRQAHGAYPWRGIDPVVVSSQIIIGLQTVISRQSELVKNAAVLTVATIHGGIRKNIIPGEVEMSGTIRTLDTNMQKEIHERIIRTATNIAESAGATAEVEIEKAFPVVYNNPQLTEKMLPTLQRVAVEKDNLIFMDADLGGEDFAFYGQQVPGLFFYIGACPPNVDPATAPVHHTPDFMMDENCMVNGMSALVNLTLDYMYSK
ncbi:MAG TPA: amidohydrolase [Cyclobacteriaceae bacterium]|nr:amidohydrolase [Cyclobacteriaceae bacterium]